MMALLDLNCRPSHGVANYVAYFAHTCVAPQVVFGEVINGFHVLAMMDGVGTRSGKPVEVVTIVDCGEL